MAKYRLSSRAATDLTEIAEYTLERFGLHQARVYRDGLAACFQQLAERPPLGHSAEDLAPNLRRYTYQSHVVFYVPDGESILIVRVLHRRQAVERHF